jgi:hypothetical protein
MNPLSGYIELELAGEVLPFKFGSNAWALFCCRYKLELYQIADSGIFGKVEKQEDDTSKVITPPSIEKMKELYYDAHVSAMRSAGKPVTINEFKFNDLLDETPDAMLRLQEAFLTSRMLGFTFAEIAEEGKKKAMKSS